MASHVMNESKVNTIAIPVLGTNNPATIVIAAKYPMRIVVRNVGGSTIFLAHSQAELSSITATTGVFQLPAGGEDTFVLAPKQGMWAAAVGIGGLVSYALSEAVPITWGES